MEVDLDQYKVCSVHSDVWSVRQVARWSGWSFMFCDGDDDKNVVLRWLFEIFELLSSFSFFFYVLNILKKKMIFLIFEKKLLCIIYFCEILWIFSKCLNFGNLFWFIEIFEMFRILCLFYFFVWFLISKKVREKNDFWIFFLILKKNTFWFFLFFQFFEILRTFWKSLIVLLFDFFIFFFWKTMFWNLRILWTILRLLKFFELLNFFKCWIL